jgi:hypothetical protein
MVPLIYQINYLWNFMFFGNSCSKVKIRFDLQRMSGY